MICDLWGDVGSWVTQLDDDCDLRNAVVFHASAQEFAKLATGNVPSWTSPSVPVAPSLGAAPTISDLSVSAVSPAVPSISTVSYSDVTNADASATSGYLYNDSNDLLAVAKLSKPLLKDMNTEALFKVKLEY